MTTTTTTKTLYVILIGWANASLYHLDKYKQLYSPTTKPTTTTILFSCPFVIQSYQVFIHPNKLTHLHDNTYQFLKLNNLIQCQSVPPNPTNNNSLIIHLFSNGGVSSLAILLSLLQSKNEQFVHINGLIIDSAPTPTAERAIWQATDLFTLQLQKYLNEYAIHLLRLCLFACMSVHSCTNKYLFNTKSQLNLNRNLFFSHPSLINIPVLFLYSTGDQLIQYESVEWFIQKLIFSRKSEHQPTFHSGAKFNIVMANQDQVKSLQYTKDIDLTEFEKKNLTLLNKSPSPCKWVVAVRFPMDSSHVQHYKTYPNQYSYIVNHFISKL